jgi:hypothetical protein
MRLAGRDPVEALGGAALHLHHMGDGVMRPGVARFGRDGLAARGFGAGVVARFLQPEGVHPEEEGPARHRVPMRQRAGDAVAERAGVGAQEVDEVARLKRDEVAREGEGVAFEMPRGEGPVAPERGLERGAVACGAVVMGQVAGRVQHGAGGGGRRGFGGEGEAPGAGEMRHGAGGRLGDGGLEGGDGVARVGREGGAAVVEAVARGGGRAGEGGGLAVVDHGEVSVFRRGAWGRRLP